LLGGRVAGGGELVGGERIQLVSDLGCAAHIGSVGEVPPCAPASTAPSRQWLVSVAVVSCN
jgi:hypothetical protein